MVNNLPDMQEIACNERDMSSTPGSRRFPGERNGNPLQHSCLEIPWTEERGVLQFFGITESDTHDLATKPPPSCKPESF